MENSEINDGLAGALLQDSGVLAHFWPLIWLIGDVS